MNADESCHGCTSGIHPFGGPANTGSASNIRVYLRSSAADCFFWVDRSGRSCASRQLDCCSRRNSTSSIHGVVLPALLYLAPSMAVACARGIRASMHSTGAPYVFELISKRRVGIAHHARFRPAHLVGDAHPTNLPGSDQWRRIHRQFYQSSRRET